MLALLILPFDVQSMCPTKQKNGASDMVASRAQKIDCCINREEYLLQIIEQLPTVDGIDYKF